MRLNLSGVRVPCYSHTLNEFLRNIDPVFFGVSNHMSVQIADSTIELSGWDNALQMLDLEVQSIGEIGNFLTHC